MFDVRMTKQTMLNLSFKISLFHFSKSLCFSLFRKCAAACVVCQDKIGRLRRALLYILIARPGLRELLDTCDTRDILNTLHTFETPDTSNIWYFKPLTVNRIHFPTLRPSETQLKQLVFSSMALPKDILLFTQLSTCYLSLCLLQFLISCELACLFYAAAPESVR